MSSGPELSSPRTPYVCLCPAGLEAAGGQGVRHRAPPAGEASRSLRLDQGRLDGGSALSSPRETLCSNLHFVGCQGWGAPSSFPLNASNFHFCLPRLLGPGLANQNAATWDLPLLEKWPGPWSEAVRRKHRLPSQASPSLGLPAAGIPPTTP